MKLNTTPSISFIFCLLTLPLYIRPRILPKLVISKAFKSLPKDPSLTSKIKPSRLSSRKTNRQPARELIHQAIKRKKHFKHRSQNTSSIIHRGKGPIRAVSQYRPTSPLERQLRAEKPNSKPQKRLKNRLKSSKKRSSGSGSFEIQYRNIKSQKVSKSVHGYLRLASQRKSKQMRKLVRQRKLVRMVIGIRKNAKKQKLQVKNVLLGQNLKKMEGGRSLFTKVQTYLNSDHLQRELTRISKKIKREKKKIRKRQRILKIRRRKKKKLEANLKIQRQTSLQPRNLPISALSSMKGKMPGTPGADNLMKFNFLPGFAGMPFPPFMMNGPHFHPPLNVTVNSLPNPNPRGQLDPKEIEEENVKTQLSALHPIADKLDHVLREIDSISKQSSVNLDDKYQRVMNLNF